MACFNMVHGLPHRVDTLWWASLRPVDYQGENVYPIELETSWVLCDHLCLGILLLSKDVYTGCRL